MKDASVSGDNAACPRRKAALPQSAPSVAAFGPITSDKPCSSPREPRDGQSVPECHEDGLRHCRDELAETRRRLAALYDAAPAGYFTLDARGVIVETNLQGATLFGVERQALIGRPFSTGVSEPDRPDFDAWFANARRPGRTPPPHGLHLVRPDGEETRAELSAGPFAGPDAPDKAALSLMAATAAPRRDPACALARRDLEMIIESAPIPIVKVRLTPEGDRVLAYQNPAAARLFGEEAVGRPCKGFLCNKETCPVFTTDAGLVRDRECAVKTLAGERIMYKTARRLPEEDAIIEAMVDVTELMRIRERLTRASAAAEAANRAKSEFLATMSHEIRTPMNGIMGMIELTQATELTSEQREYLDLARQSASSLLEIINDILDFSRIEAGRMELARTPFSLRQTLSATLGLFEPMAARQGDVLTLDVAAATPDALLGDPGRLAQIVTNLVSNGLKFTKNGAVRLTVRPTGAPACLADRPGGRTAGLVFAVTDTGIGIPADKQERIFEYFTQLDAGLNRAAGGTGLGLSISKNLAALMGGRLWVESEPGAGSTFSFTAFFELPPDAPRTVPGPERRDRPGNASPLSILLVEDNMINQLVAKRLLERRGHEVMAVDSGMAALEILKVRPFHCVLMDMEMPGLNGRETLARLREATAFGEAASTPVVALTAHAVKGYREQILAAGFDDYVSKPIDIGELEKALARATGSARGQRGA